MRVQERVGGGREMLWSQRLRASLGGSKRLGGRERARGRKGGRVNSSAEERQAERAGSADWAMQNHGFEDFTGTKSEGGRSEERGCEGERD